MTQRCNFPRIAANKPIFFASLGSALRLTWDCGRTDNLEIQGLASTWDAILIPAQDATQQRGAATTQREASLGAKGVTNYTTGTRTSKHQDSNPPAHTQPTWRHKRCKPDGREHGHNAHHPHLRCAQSAATSGPYDPCNTTNTAAPTWPGRNSTAKVQAPNLACTIPSLRGRTRATQSSDLSRGQSKDSCPGMRLRPCSKIWNKANIRKNQPSHGMIHGRTKPAMQTLTHTPCTQLLSRRGTPSITVIPCKTHSMKNTGILSPLLGRPDTIPSGKDTGILARSSDLCRGVSTDCNFWQTRSCRCRFFT